MTTYKQLVKHYEKILRDRNLDENAAKVLFAYAADKPGPKLYLMMDEEAEESVVLKFESAMNDYLAGKPVQYITGSVNFFGRDFIVNEDVLIPRYETEELVERVLEAIDDCFPEGPLDVVDVGTGSGAIAVSLKAEQPRLRVWATDISAKALAVAQKNAQVNQADVTFLEGDLLEPLIARHLKFDVFVSNPPYIPLDQEIDPLVRDNEPHVALFGGGDGLYFYRLIFQKVRQVLKEKAILAFEMGYDQADAMRKEMDIYFPHDDYEIIKDMSGKDRMLLIYLKGAGDDGKTG